MKKLLLVLAFLLFSSGTLLCQPIKMFYPNEGWNYLVSNVSQIQNYELIGIAGLEEAGNPALILDFNNGSASNWSYVFKSKDTSDHVMKMYLVRNQFNQFNHAQFPVPGEDAQKMPALKSGWMNTDSLAKKILSNTAFMNFYNARKTELTSKLLGLANQDNENDTWEVMAVANNVDTADCHYFANNGSLKYCTFPPTGIREIVQKVLEVYPNPSNNIITIDVPFSGSAQLEIYNLFGMLVKTENRTIDQSASIDISELPVGSYLIKLTYGNNVYVNRIQVVR